MKLKKIFYFLRRKRVQEKKAKTFAQSQIDLDKKLVISLSKSRIPNLKQIKYLPRFFSRKEIWAIRILSIIALASLIFLGTKLYLTHIELSPQNGGEYIEGLVGSPQYINPLFAPANDVDMDISKFIFAGLLKYNQNLELAPDLATKYEISSDGKNYTFYLREGVKWHDGETFDANDVIFTIESIQNQEFKSPLNVSFKGVKVEKIDQNTVQFTLEESFSPFLGVLTLGILPEHLWSGILPASANLAEYNLKPVGLGPYKFKSLTKDKSGNIKLYTLEKFENYFGQKPYLEKIVFKFYPDFTSALQALQNKDVLGVSFLPPEFREKFKNKNLKHYSFSLPQCTAIFFNQKNNEILKDKTVRQALAHSINKARMITEVLGGEGKIIHSPILPGYVGYHPEIKKYSFDLETSQTLLDQVGWKLIDSERKKDEQVLEITLTTVDKETFQRIAQIIKQNWEALGIKVNLQTISGSRIQNEIIKPRDYETLLYGEIVGPDPDPFPFWHSSQALDPGLNLALFSNRHADKLLEEARQIYDPAERQEKYVEFQNILAEEIPSIFLYNPAYIYVVDEEIKGISIERINIPSDRFIGLEEWYMKVKRSWK